MIGFIRGTVFEVNGNRVLIDNNGIGYEVLVTGETAGRLSFAEGEVLLYTSLSLKDEVFSLFGFLEKEELSLFKLLITVSGIGPKGALSILSSMTVSELCNAIASEDAKRISMAPGIGKKTAEKAIIELKDKIEAAGLSGGFAGNSEYFPGYTASGKKEVSPAQAVKEDAIAALTALGFSASDASKAVGSVEISDSSDLEEVIRLALKR